MPEVLTAACSNTKVDGICYNMVIFKNHVKCFNKISYTFQLWIMLLLLYYYSSYYFLYAKCHLISYNLVSKKNAFLFFNFYGC